MEPSATAAGFLVMREFLTLLLTTRYTHVLFLSVLVAREVVIAAILATTPEETLNARSVFIFTRKTHPFSAYGTLKARVVRLGICWVNHVRSISYR